MPLGKYGMQEEWEKEGDQGILMDFLLPTGIFLKFPVSPNDTIKSIKKVGLHHLSFQFLQYTSRNTLIYIPLIYDA